MSNIFFKLGFSTLVQAIGKTLSIFISLASVAILTRYLGVSSYGNYALVFAYLSFFGAISDVGLNATVINEINKKGDIKKITGSYFWLKIITSLASFLIPVFLLLFFPYSSDQKTAIIIGAFAFGIGNLAGFGNTFLQARLRLDIMTLIDICGRLTTFVFTFIFVIANADLFVLISAVLIGNLVIVFLNFLAVRKNLKIDFSIQTNLLIQLVKTSIPIGLATLLSFIYFRVDTILLSLLKGPREVGIYGLSYKIFENSLTFWAFYIGAFYPIFVKYHNNREREKYIKLFKNSVKAAVVFGVFLMIFGMIFAPVLVKILAGNEFTPSVLPLRILMLSSGLFFINVILYYFIFIKNRPAILIKSLVFSLIINICLNLILIPRFSYVGASITTVFTEVFLLIFYVYQIRKISF